MTRQMAVMVTLCFLAVAVILTVFLPMMGQGYTDTDDLHPGPDDPNPALENIKWSIENPIYSLGIMGSITVVVLLAGLWVDRNNRDSAA